MPTILIVDDSCNLATFISRMLVRQLSAASVTVVPSLAEATRVVAQGRPDVILLDLQLPDACAIEPLVHFLNCVGSSRVILMTGNRSRAEQLAAIWSVDSVLHKPFEASELLFQVSRSLGKLVPPTKESPPDVANGDPIVGAGCIGKDLSGILAALVEASRIARHNANNPQVISAIVAHRIDPLIPTIARLAKSIA